MLKKHCELFLNVKALFYHYCSTFNHANYELPNIVNISFNIPLVKTLTNKENIFNFEELEIQIDK
jgi:hypothetical protein